MIKKIFNNSLMDYDNDKYFFQEDGILTIGKERYVKINDEIKV